MSKVPSSCPFFAGREDPRWLAEADERIALLAAVLDCHDFCAAAGRPGPRWASWEAFETLLRDLSSHVECLDFL